MLSIRGRFVCTWNSKFQVPSLGKNRNFPSFNSFALKFSKFQNLEFPSPKSWKTTFFQVLIHLLPKFPSSKTWNFQVVFLVFCGFSKFRFVCFDFFDLEILNLEKRLGNLGIFYLVKIQLEIFSKCIVWSFYCMLFYFLHILENE